MGQLNVVDATTSLEKAKVALHENHYVEPGEWAIADPKPPLATTGAGPCLVAVVHHRSANRGGLVHVNTSSTNSQKQLFDSALAAIGLLLTKCVLDKANTGIRSDAEAFDLFLGAGKEFEPGKVLSSAREALPTSHKDFPAWISDALCFDFTFKIIDRRFKSGWMPAPTGPFYDTGAVVYDAASDTVLVLDQRDPSDVVRNVTARSSVKKDESARDVRWGKHK
jgi:hypothetical protein